MFAAGSDMAQIPREVRTYIASSNIQQRVEMNLNIMLFFSTVLPCHPSSVRPLSHFAPSSVGLIRLLTEGLEKVLSLKCQTPFHFYMCLFHIAQHSGVPVQSSLLRGGEKFIDFSIIVFHHS